MGADFRDSPIKSGEKTVEVQDPLVEVNLRSDRNCRLTSARSFWRSKKKSSSAFSKGTKAVLLGAMMRCRDSTERV